ncbi:MAG: S8 family serine peptidase, partial [Chloroflexota bacterium]
MRRHPFSLVLAVVALLALVAERPAGPWPTSAAGAAAPSRLDRHLRALQARAASPAARSSVPRAASPLQIERVGGETLVDVIVRGRRNLSRELKGSGAVVRSTIGANGQWLHTARVPVGSLDRLAAVAGITQVDASLALRPLLDISTGSAHTQAQEVWSGVRDRNGAPVTGKGVIIGVVDTGIDWSHADFVRPDGQSRILALWDQTASPPAPPAGYDYGRAWTKTHVDAWLAAGIIPGDTCTTSTCLAAGASGAPSEIDGNSEGGHGTHVTAIAAAGGRAITGATPASYTGMAPDADILFVKTDLDSAHIIDAWAWIVAQAQAAGKPVVINSSFGGHDGAHDGTHPLETAIDSLSGPGVIFTVAAGNSGDDRSHGSGTAAVGAPSTAKVQLDPSSGVVLSVATIDLWYRGADHLRLAVIGPDG